MSLLPLNSTKFEKAVEQAIGYNVVVDVLAGFKFKANGSSVTLAWEYSLAQVNIDDFAERVLKGLEFHRLRGTPISLRNALSWYGFNDIIIEEEVPGEHFAEFQIGIEEIPNGFVPDPVINVAAFAAPLRSRLSRMYNKLYDERRFILDNSQLDESLLSDDSGTRLGEDEPKLSFGRINNYAIELPIPVVDVAKIRDHFAFAKNVDTYRLDFAYLDDAPLDAVNWKSAIERERSIFNPDTADEIPAELFEARRFSRASIILSEDAELDDLNTTFSGGYDESDETPFILSSSFLSQNKTTVKRVLIDERFLRERGCHAVSDFEYESAGGTCERARSVVFEYSGCSEFSTMERECSTTGEYRGADIWRDHRHFPVPWNEQAEYTQMLKFEEKCD
jgi:hypothetical protein